MKRIGIKQGLFALGLTLAGVAQAADGDAMPREATALVPVDPNAVTIVARNRAAGVLTVIVILQVHDALEQGAVAVQKPRLHDAYRQTLADLAARRLDIRRPLDIVMLDRYLQRSTDQALGEGRATVLIQSAVVNTSG